LKFSYPNKKIEKTFTDYNQMQKKLKFDWVRAIKKLINQLEASDNFGVFLSLGLGHPESLSGYKIPTYSLRITANVRLIIELKTDDEDVKNCEEIEVKGVCDYHGDKENWYIP